MAQAQAVSRLFDEAIRASRMRHTFRVAGNTAAARIYSKLKTEALNQAIHVGGGLVWAVRSEMEGIASVRTKLTSQTLHLPWELLELDLGNLRRTFSAATDQLLAEGAASVVAIREWLAALRRLPISRAEFARGRALASGYQLATTAGQSLSTEMKYDLELYRKRVELLIF